MLGVEAAVAEEWLFSTLNGDSQLRGGATPLVQGVWNTEAAPGATYPFIVFQFMSGNDLDVVGSVRIWTDMIYMVKVIGETADYGDLKAAVSRVDQLLHRSSGSAADGSVWVCVREQAIQMPDSVENRQYRHSGGLFRILAIAT